MKDLQIIKVKSVCEVCGEKVSSNQSWGSYKGGIAHGACIPRVEGE